MLLPEDRMHIFVYLRGMYSEYQLAPKLSMLLLEHRMYICTFLCIGVVLRIVHFLCRMVHFCVLAWYSASFFMLHSFINIRYASSFIYSFTNILYASSFIHSASSRINFFYASSRINSFLYDL